MAVFDYKADRARGKRFTERAGLDPATTNVDWSAEALDGGTVLVRLETLLILSKDEYEAIYEGKETA